MLRSVCVCTLYGICRLEKERKSQQPLTAILRLSKCHKKRNNRAGTWRERVREKRGGSFKENDAKIKI
jgi:hypothetical protein